MTIPLTTRLTISFSPRFLYLVQGVIFYEQIRTPTPTHTSSCNENKIHTQAELQALLADNDIQVTQATLSRDIKTWTSQKYEKKTTLTNVLNTSSISNGKNSLEIYMEDALVLMRPVQHQVLLKNPSWTGSIIWFYHWCFEFPWRYRYPLWRWCMSCHLWRCRCCTTLLWRIAKIYTTILLWWIMTTRLTGGLNQGYKPKLPASA